MILFPIALNNILMSEFKWNQIIIFAYSLWILKLLYGAR